MPDQRVSRGSTYLNILNQIFIQLREADKHARSGLPQERRIAVVLLDNLFELQLRRKAEFVFSYDQTTWHSGVRKYSRELRTKVLRFHPELVNFAIELGWIDKKEGIFLTYAHRIRNSFYHSGDYDELDSEIAIQIFYKLIKSKFPEWKTARGINSWGLSYWDKEKNKSIKLPDYQIFEWGFENQLDKLHKSNPFSKEFWVCGIDHLLQHKTKKPLAILISDKLKKIIDKIERNLNFISSDGMDVDWNYIFKSYSSITGWFSYNIHNNKPITDINIVLNIYMIINSYEESLYDIVDEKERDKLFFDYLQAHNFKASILSRDKLEDLKVTTRKLRREKEAKAISIFVEAESYIRKISKAIEVCASDLDGWIQFQVDCARGK